MSRGKVDAQCAKEQKKKEAEAARKAADQAATNAARSGEAADTQETKRPENRDSVPVDLEDYKGARKKLRHAVKAVVKVKSKEIATKLVSKVEAGDMLGTKMMLSLIEKKKQGKDEKKKKKWIGPSWEELLNSEPEWDESMEESGGTALAVAGGKRPGS